MYYNCTYGQIKAWKVLSVLAVLLMQVGIGLGQVYTFTNAGATGVNGPTQTQVDNAYASTTLANSVTVVAGIQNWSVPVAGLYKIEVYGANGHGVYGGKGAYMSGEFNFNASDVLKILVGQMGQCCSGAGTNQYGGGGGSFVVSSTNTPLIIAGGGGGGSTFYNNVNLASSHNPVADADITTSGKNASGSTNGTGGTAGNGGNTGNTGGGGGGFLTNGSGIQGGLSFLNGGTGGNPASATGIGGFGGGGGITGQNNMRAGGGGGYSGGGGCGSSTTVVQIGGGGGSFNSGANQVNTPGLGTGHGTVIITLLVPAVSAPNNAGVTSLPSLVGNFCPGNQNVTVRVRNFGNNFIDSVKIGWSVNGVVQSDIFYKVGVSQFPTLPYDTVITLGSYNFVPGLQVVKAWTSLPNNQADPATNNDTINANVTPSMVGAYTINSAVATGGTNYQTFTDFVNSLAQNGICGPVIANVDAGSGPYNEQINIPQINGASSTNTITINGNGRTITMSTPSASNYATINLDGADYITINDLTIEALHASTGFGVHLMNSSNNNVFKKCTINANPTATTTTSGGVSMSGSAIAYTTAGTNGSNNSFDSCTVTGGYFNFFFYGATSGSDSMNNITNCILLNNYVYSTYCYYQNSNVISNNIIDRSTRATVSTGYGPLLTTGCVNNLIEKNTVRGLFPGTNTGTAYLLYCAVDGTAGRENKFINNVVYNIGGNGTLYGMYFSGADHIQAYNNTIVLDNTTSTGGDTYGIYSTGTLGGIDLRNNNVYITRGGTGTKYCAYYTGAGAKTSNYNNFYINASAGTNAIGYDGAARVTLNDWQTMGTGAGSPFDANSQNADPMFANAAAGNLTPTNSMLDNLGVSIASVTHDINNVARDPNTPDIGAIEFSVPPCSGTPVAGTASTNDTFACNGGSVNLSLTGFSIGAGISVQWQESYVPNVWTDIIGATTANYTATFAGTVQYRAAVMCNMVSPAYSNVLTVNANPVYACYCSPMTGVPLHTNTGNYITKVEITGTPLSNTTAAVGTGGYSRNYPTTANTTASLTTAVNYGLNVTLGAATYTSMVWIDYDHNGSFDQGEETTITGGFGTINIPTTATPGLTGMRVRAANATAYTNADACANLTTGYETEDYIINIIANQTCSGTPATGGTAGVSRDTLCISGDVKLSLTGYPLNIGINLNWQSSPAGANTFTDISGATTDTFTVYGVASSTDFRARVTCSSVGGGTTYSNVKPVVVNNPSLLNTIPGSRCGTGSVVLYARGANGANVNWYAAPTGGAPLATGTNFVTPSISATTPYYAAAALGGSGNGAPELMYYKFDVPGTTVMNEATNPVGNNPATVTGLTIGGTGQFGTGLQGNAGATATNRVDPGWTGTHTGSWTISFWMNVPTPPTTRYMFGNSSGNGTFRCFIGGAAQGIRLTGGVPTMTLDMPSWTPGIHVVTYVYDQTAGTVTGYIDGVLQASQSPGASYPLVGTNFVVGSQGTSIEGTMDEFRMYSRALSASEVASSWNITLGGCEGPRTQVDATINAGGTGTLATGGTVESINQTDGTTENYNSSCGDRVATVVDAVGGNVLGVTTARAIVSPSVMTYNNLPYVPRVHDITPTSNGPATVTIYALQSEFNAYNTWVTTNNPSLPLLPTSGSDPNISNIRITQWHGNANAGNSGPGAMYGGLATFINSGITATTNGTYWTMTFPVTGFSGFFVHTGATPLPIHLASIHATNVGSRNRVDWMSADEKEAQYYELQRSGDGKEYSRITTQEATGRAHSYSYWDEEPLTGMNYYRLKMYDKSGKYSYSEVVKAFVNTDGALYVEAYPNPVASDVTVKVNGVQAGTATIQVTDVTGKLIKTVKMNSSVETIDMSGLANGIYLIKYSDATHTQTIKVNKQ